MSYSDFLDSVLVLVRNIIFWIGTLADSLLSNYIVITILGFILFSSLFSLILYIIGSLKKDHKTDYDNIK